MVESLQTTIKSYNVTRNLVFINVYIDMFTAMRKEESTKIEIIVNATR
jgi:hypothetical protein